MRYVLYEIRVSYTLHSPEGDEIGKGSRMVSVQGDDDDEAAKDMAAGIIATQSANRFPTHAVIAYKQEVIDEGWTCIEA